MLRFMMISCKKATYLHSKKEENRLSWLEAFQLRGHLTICVLCRRFAEQARLIVNQMQRQGTVDNTLPEERKQTIQQAFDAQK